MLVKRCYVCSKKIYLGLSGQWYHVGNGDICCYEDRDDIVAQKIPEGSVWVGDEDAV